MSDRLTRKDIKHDIQQDEFVATVGRGVDYAQHHVRQLLLVLGGVVLLGAVVLGGRAWFAHRGDAAQNALAMRASAGGSDRQRGANPTTPAAEPSQRRGRRRAPGVFRSVGRSMASRLRRRRAAHLASSRLGGSAERPRLWHEYLASALGRAGRRPHQPVESGRHRTSRCGAA